MEEDIGNSFYALASLTPISNHCNRGMADWGDIAIEIGEGRTWGGREGDMGDMRNGKMQRDTGKSSLFFPLLLFLLTLLH